MGPKTSRMIRRGYFSRTLDGSRQHWVRVARFQCLDCRRSFSEATLSPEYRQQKRQFNSVMGTLHCSSVTQRRLAKLLALDRKTIVRRFLWLGEMAKQALLDENERRIAQSPSSESRVSHLQFDEMETFEHTKCKPLSIGLAVCAKSRRILGISVASMPASGPLAEISRRKYGPRKDERSKEARALLSRIAPLVAPDALITTDQKTLYPIWLKPFFPGAKHKAVKGRRARVTGQGELKKGGWDPIFALNHTAAMIRANVSRMVRKTWSTTKKPERLLAHLYLYAHFHNQELLARNKPAPN